MKLSQRLAVRFLNLATIFLIKDVRSPPQFMFDANHFHIEATWRVQILSNCQNILHNVYKEGYIQSKVGSHIITGVP